MPENAKANANTPTGAGANAFCLYGDVGTPGVFDASKVSEALSKIKDGAGVTIYLNSLGGDVFEAQAIVSRLGRFNGQKIIVIEGVAASAASLIAMAGDKIIMSPGAMMMIHMPFTMAAGTSDELKSRAAALDEVLTGIVEIYAKRTKNTPEQIRSWMAAETWMSARTAKERGFCDAIQGEEPDQGGVQNASAGMWAAARARFECVLKAHGNSKTDFSNNSQSTSRGLGGAAPSCPVAPDGGGKEPHTMTPKMLAELGLAEDAVPEMAMNALCALKAQAAQAASLTAKADELTAQNKALEDEKAALAAKVAALEDEKRETKVAAILDSLKREGRLVPAQEEWARGLGMSNLDSLLAFASTAPVIVSMKSAAESPADADKDASTLKKPFAEMTADEKAALFASSPELYAKMKAGA